MVTTIASHADLTLFPYSCVADKHDFCGLPPVDT